jgi:hypothetical protein
MAGSFTHVRDLRDSAVMALAGLLTAVVALIVAVASAAYTRRQAVAAEAVIAIEQTRLHAELTPDLAISCTKPRGASNVDALMTIELTGPTALDRLDEVTLRIRDDRPNHRPPQSGALETVYGPYRIDPLLHLTDEAGRQHGPFPLPKNEPHQALLMESVPPAGYGHDWNRQWEGKPVRLQLDCRRDGHEPWIVLQEVTVVDSPRLR